MSPAQKDTAKKDAVKKDAPKKTAVKKDVLKKDALKKDALKKDVLKKDVLKKDVVHAGAAAESATRATATASPKRTRSAGAQPPPAAATRDPLQTPFVLVIGQVDAVPALKAAALTQGLRPSYHRRGLLTFKTDRAVSPLLPAPFASAFARFCAPCFGRLDDAGVQALATAIATRTGRGVRLHMVGGERPAALSKPPFLAPTTDDAIEAGTPVITLVHDDTARWTTLHVHGPDHVPFAGGDPKLALPAEAPSRAWLKLEEAVRLFDLPLHANERVLEVGSAPGGASTALLQRGHTVIGMDPNAMDPRVLANKRFTHLQTSSHGFDPTRLPQPIHWIVVDVNVPPGTAIAGVAAILEHCAPTLRGVIFTLKLKSWNIVHELPSWMARLERRVPGLTVRALQLPSNGQELCVAGTVSAVRRVQAQSKRTHDAPTPVPLPEPRARKTDDDDDDAPPKRWGPSWTPAPKPPGGPKRKPVAGRAKKPRTP